MELDFQNFDGDAPRHSHAEVEPKADFFSLFCSWCVYTKRFSSFSNFEFCPSFDLFSERLSEEESNF